MERILILGTAINGPINQPIIPKSIKEAKMMFGLKILDEEIKLASSTKMTIRRSELPEEGEIVYKEYKLQLSNKMIDSEYLDGNIINLQKKNIDENGIESWENIRPSNMEIDVIDGTLTITYNHIIQYQEPSSIITASKEEDIITGLEKRETTGNKKVFHDKIFTKSDVDKFFVWKDEKKTIDRINAFVDEKKVRVLSSGEIEDTEGYISNNKPKYDIIDKEYVDLLINEEGIVKNLRAEYLILRGNLINRCIEALERVEGEIALIRINGKESTAIFRRVKKTGTNIEYLRLLDITQTLPTLKTAADSLIIKSVFGGKIYNNVEINLYPDYIEIVNVDVGINSGYPIKTRYYYADFRNIGELCERINKDTVDYRNIVTFFSDEPWLSCDLLSNTAEILENEIDEEGNKFYSFCLQGGEDEIDMLDLEENEVDFLDIPEGKEKEISEWEKQSLTTKTLRFQNNYDIYQKLVDIYSNMFHYEFSILILPFFANDLVVRKINLEKIIPEWGGSLDERDEDIYRYNESKINHFTYRGKEVYEKVVVLSEFQISGEETYSSFEGQPLIESRININVSGGDKSDGDPIIIMIMGKRDIEEIEEEVSIFATDYTIQTLNLFTEIAEIKITPGSKLWKTYPNIEIYIDQINLLTGCIGVKENKAGCLVKNNFSESILVEDTNENDSEIRIKDSSSFIEADDGVSAYIFDDDALVKKVAEPVFIELAAFIYEYNLLQGGLIGILPAYRYKDREIDSYSASINIYNTGFMTGTVGTRYEIGEIKNKNKDYPGKFIGLITTGQNALYYKGIPTDGSVTLAAQLFNLGKIRNFELDDDYSLESRIDGVKEEEISNAIIDMSNVLNIIYKDDVSNRIFLTGNKTCVDGNYSNLRNVRLLHLIVNELLDELRPIRRYGFMKIITDRMIESTLDSVIAKYIGTEVKEYSIDVTPDINSLTAYIDISITPFGQIGNLSNIFRYEVGG